MADTGVTDDKRLRHVIPAGTWQFVAGVLLVFFGLFALIGGHNNGGDAIGGLSLALGTGCLFWGVMQRYFHILEAKLLLVIERTADPAPPPLPAPPAIDPKQTFSPMA